MTRLVAPASPAGVSETSGGALAGVLDVGVEPRFSCLALEIHARPREILALVGLHRGAPARDDKGEDESALQGETEAFSPGFSGAKWRASVTRGVRNTRVVVRSHGCSAIMLAAYGPTE